MVLVGKMLASFPGFKTAWSTSRPRASPSRAGAHTLYAEAVHACKFACVWNGNENVELHSNPQYFNTSLRLQSERN